MEEDKRIKGIKQQEAEIAKKQEQHKQRVYIDGLLRLYQDARAIEKTDVSTLAVNLKKDVIVRLSYMVNIVERDDWQSVHPHDAFPDIDIRMLIYECPYDIECPFLKAILKKIHMSNTDYNSYKQRAGKMITIEHSRKVGKRK